MLSFFNKLIINELWLIFWIIFYIQSLKTKSTQNANSPGKMLFQPACGRVCILTPIAPKIYKCFQLKGLHNVNGYLISHYTYNIGNRTWFSILLVKLYPEESRLSWWSANSNNIQIVRENSAQPIRYLFDSRINLVQIAGLLEIWLGMCFCSLFANWLRHNPVILALTVDVPDACCSFVKRNNTFSLKK